MAKNKILALIFPLMLLSSCGDALDTCRDDDNFFPTAIDFPRITIRKHLTYQVNDFTTRFEQLPEEEKNDLNVIQYAEQTSLKTTANLANNVKYLKLFDGEISCAGKVANSRLHLYSTGIYVDLNRYLQTADRLGIYMTSATKTLKIKATMTLYSLVDRMTSPYTYDAHDFTFQTDLKHNANAPYFYSFKASDLMIPANLKETRLVGFSYERLPLSEEEAGSGTYAPYIEDETNAESFVKVYDISLPQSTWTK